MSTQSPPSVGGPVARRSTRALVSRFATGAAVIAALVGLVYTLSSTETKVPLRYPEHLEGVTPENGSQNVPAQSSIAADLEFGYSGALIVNGKELPKDQVDETVATGVVRFTPGPDKDIRRLPGGAVNITVVFWPTQGNRDVDSQSYQWVLNVN